MLTILIKLGYKVISNNPREFKQIIQQVMLNKKFCWVKQGKIRKRPSIITSKYL